MAHSPAFDEAQAAVNKAETDEERLDKMADALVLAATEDVAFVISMQAAVWLADFVGQDKWSVAIEQAQIRAGYPEGTVLKARMGIDLGGGLVLPLGRPGPSQAPDEVEAA